MEKILSKIKKLLAMARDKGASESEVEQALRHAHRLMAEHNVSEADVKQSDGINETRIVWTNKGMPSTWCFRLLGIIAEFNWCAALRERDRARKKETFVIAGKEENRMVCAAIYEVLVPTYHDLQNLRYQSKIRDISLRHPHFTVKEMVEAGFISSRPMWRKSYQRGVLAGIVESYATAHSDAIKELYNYGIVKSVSDVKIKDYMAEKWKDAKPMQVRRVTVDADGYQAGKMDGRLRKKLAGNG